MWLFKKASQKDIWDEEIQWPLGDIEAAHRIRDICRAATECAEKASERPRYERAAKCAMTIAIKISDDLLRDSSVRQIVDLCMKASDVRTSRILMRAIQSATIREDLLTAHPTLRE